MNFRDLLLGLRRRWYVVLVGLLITAGLAGAVGTLVSPQYTTTTSLLLLPPKSALGTNGNPFLNLGGLSQALEVLSTRVNASDENQQLLKQHPEATVTVGADPTTAGPIILVSATAPSADESTALRNQVAQELPAVLESMQSDLQVRANSQITLSTLATDAKPERDIKNLLRAVIVVLAMGATLTFLFTGYLDSVLIRRRTRRIGTGGTVASGSAVAAGSTTTAAKLKRPRKVRAPEVTSPVHGWDFDEVDESTAGPRRPAEKILAGAESGASRDRH